MTKACRDCGETKPWEDFPTHRAHGKVYLRSCCRPCHNARSREYRDRNLDRCRKREFDYARAHSERKREIARKHYEDNREAKLAYQSSYNERRYYSEAPEDRLWVIAHSLMTRRSSVLRRLEKRHRRLEEERCPTLDN